MDTWDNSRQTRVMVSSPHESSASHQWENYSETRVSTETRGHITKQEFVKIPRNRGTVRTEAGGRVSESIFGFDMNLAEFDFGDLSNYDFDFAA